MSAPADPDRYRGSASYYSRGRLPYPHGLAEALTGAVGLRPHSRLLDVGCGPGRLTFELADRYDDVVGVDVDADMLAVAEQTARERELAWVEFRHLPAEEIDQRLGTFDTITFALSFHWMDQPRVAEAVRSVLRPGGACVHVYAPSLQGEPIHGQPAPPYDEVNALRDRYLGTGWRGRTGRADPDVAATAMSGAGFEGPDVVTVPGGEVVTSTVDDLVARYLSTASSAPVRFGGRAEAFDRELRTVLMDASPNGRFAERLLDARLDVWRPAPSR